MMDESIRPRGGNGDGVGDRDDDLLREEEEEEGGGATVAPAAGSSGVLLGVLGGVRPRAR